MKHLRLSLFCIVLSCLLSASCCASLHKQISQRICHSFLPPQGHFHYYLPHTPLDMAAVVHTTLLNNRDLRALYGKLGMAKALFWQAHLLTNPIGDISFKPLHLTQSPYILESSVLQSLLDILLRPLRKKAAYWHWKTVEAEATSVIVATVAHAKRGYLALKYAEQAFELGYKRLSIHKLLFEIAGRLYHAGNLTEKEYLHRQIAYEQIKQDLLMMQNHITIAREQLNALMGLADQAAEQWQLDEEPWQLCCPSYMQSNVFEELAMRNNLALLKMRYQACNIAAEGCVKKAEAIMPELNAGMAAEREGGNWFVGPKLEWAFPIWDWGQARCAYARAALRELQEKYLAKKVKIRAEARAIFCTLRNHFEQAQQYACELVPLQVDNVDATQLWYNAMQVGIFQLLEAKDQEIKTRLEGLRALHEYLSAHILKQELISGGHTSILQESIE